MFDGEISHDQVSRHLRSGDYGSKELWNYVKPEIRRHEQKADGVLLLDDTISEKPYPDENTANCWHYSHMNHFVIKQKLLIKANQIMLNELQLLKAAA